MASPVPGEDQGLGFRGSGFRALGLRVLGFKALGFRALSLQVCRTFALVCPPPQEAHTSTVILTGFRGLGCRFRVQRIGVQGLGV